MAREYTKVKHLEAAVFALKDQGKTNAQIGTELGLTKAQIKGLIKRYNRRFQNDGEEQDTYSPVPEEAVQPIQVNAPVQTEEPFEAKPVAARHLREKVPAQAIEPLNAEPEAARSIQEKAPEKTMEPAEAGLEAERHTEAEQHTQQKATALATEHPEAKSDTVRHIRDEAPVQAGVPPEPKPEAVRYLPEREPVQAESPVSLAGIHIQPEVEQELCRLTTEVDSLEAQLQMLGRMWNKIEKSKLK